MKRFYVYRIFHQDTTLYIGKGSGRRLERQKRKFTADGEIIARFSFETDAYRAERRFIALMRPYLNKSPGGNGGKWGRIRYANLPNGLTPEAVPYIGPLLARLIWIWATNPNLNGLLKILGAYVDAHGEETIMRTVPAHIKRLRHQYLARGNTDACLETRTER